MQAGLQELEKFGWLERIKTRNSQGQWDIEYILHSRSTVSENQTPSNAENQTRHRDRLSVDGKSANNNKKQHTKNINTISNDIVLSSQQNCDDKMPKKEKDFSLKNSKTDSEINSE